MDYGWVRAELAVWAAGEENVRAVVVTGSVARGADDGLSDLDVEVYVRDGAPLLSTPGWYERFGEVLVVEALPNPGSVPTRLVYYRGGKIDFSVVAVDRPPPRHDRPFVVLVDKDGSLADRAAVAGPATGVGGVPCSPSELRETDHWFWAAALMCARAVVRREPWVASGRLRDAQSNLLRMVEWDHKARYGWSYETWFLGKHLRDWADADVVDALGGCFARLDESEIVEALVAAVELFVRLSDRTSGNLGMAEFHHAQVRAELDRILALGRSPQAT
jgi:aminoglycoside 6-adenylyltransferase